MEYRYRTVSTKAGPRRWTRAAAPNWRSPREPLQKFVAEERAQHTVYPPSAEVFSALYLTPFADVKVLILGQDPYHGPRQAHGLCFSVRPGVERPPSLVNIFKELHDDLGLRPPNHGCLEGWAQQGVLLLNAVLTVRANNANSHQGKGWEQFTDEIIRTVNERTRGRVIWGADARRRGVIDTTDTSSSSSPSVTTVGSNGFSVRQLSRANAPTKGRDPIDGPG